MRHKNKRPKERNRKDRQKNCLCDQVKALEKELLIEQAKKSKIKKGTVISYSCKKGYGFIKQDVNPDNIYFHVTQCKEEPEIKIRVQYEIAEGRKGLEAVNITII